VRRANPVQYACDVHFGKRYRCFPVSLYAKNALRDNLYQSAQEEAQPKVNTENAAEFWAKLSARQLFYCKEVFGRA